MEAYVKLSLTRALFFILLTLSFAFSACTAREPVVQQPEEGQAVHSILILPVEILPAFSKKQDKETARQLNEGTQVLTGLLHEYFSSTPSVTFISETQKDALTSDFSGCDDSLCRFIGQKMNADAVFRLTLNRFIEREGTNYSVNTPAAITFDYKLKHVKTGQILCSGAFDEQQQSLFANILSFSAKRGLKWLTAEALAREGIEKKLGSCGYLQPSE